jgi:hypothetical protein
MTIPHIESEPTIHTADVADLVVDFVRERRGGVTFVEIERHLIALGFPTKGHLALGIEGQNVWFWFDMSAPFVALIRELQTSGRLAMKPTIWLTYALDSCLPTMPVAVRPPANGYKHPRWAPVVFNVPGTKR